MKLTVLLCLFSFYAHAATDPALWRIDLNVGYGNMNYTEIREGVPLATFAPKDIDEKAMVVEFSFLQYILAPGIDLTAGAQFFGLNPSEPENTNEQFQSIYSYLNLGINFYTFNDFVSIRLVFEGFNQNITSEGNFGFKNLWGGQIYPDIEILPFGTDMFLQISPFVKIPLLTDSGKRSEFTAGLKIKIPTSSNSRQMKFPAYSYQKAIVLKFFYRKVELLFAKSGFVDSDIKTSEIVGTLGFSF